MLDSDTKKRIKVRLVSSIGVEIEIDIETLTVIPAGDYIIMVSGERVGVIEIDGLPTKATSIGQERILSVSLIRSVGYHVLRVGSSDFMFATNDGKLRIEGVAEVARALEPESALGWNGQLLFADGGSLDNAKTRFAWLWRHAPEIATQIESIGRSPKSKAKTKSALSTSIRGRLDVPSTIRAIRKNYSLLQLRSPGAVSLNSGKSYTPAQAAIVRRGHTALTPGNISAYALARLTLSSFYAIKEAVPKEKLEYLRASVRRIERALAFPLYRLISLEARAVLPSTTVVAEALTDSRYALVVSRLRELRRPGWSPSAAASGRSLAFIRYADEIYQAFVAVSLALAFDCVSAYDQLKSRRDRPSFEGKEFAIYYDTKPPKTLIKGWRSVSDRPDDPRPDILLVRKATNEVLLIDAKYRNNENRASVDSLYEMQYYLGASGIRVGRVEVEPAAMEQDCVRKA